MSYRPYPSVDRALRQRRRSTRPAVLVPRGLRASADGMSQIQTIAVDEYRLSTRRPGVGVAP